MRRWPTALLPTLVGVAWLLCLFAPLLSPVRALANRDIAAFHLPLRTAFRDLAAFGLPVWNPWLHGGQPLLSNPSYGAFYPPSWLIFLAPPTYALSLMALLHAAIAFAGAWRLARHFGCGPGAAALAGVGYVGCGAFLSLLSIYTLFGSMAWFPWVLAWGDESLRMPPGERWWRPGVLSGCALGLQLLNGEPSTVVLTGLGLLALAAAAAGRRLAAAPRILVPFLFALALAAVQVLPTLDRLAESPRNLSAEVAMTWSMPPERWIEIVFPRFFGDPDRDVEGLYFGWNLNDRDYPYVESLYPGLLLSVLGASALLRGRIPRRTAWTLSLAGGAFLALGRHNPLYAILREAIPVLAVLRYPEKFVLLVVFSLVIAGVLGWQRLLDEREAGRPETAELPLALALIVLATTLLLAALLRWQPQAALWFIAAHGSPMFPSSRHGIALQYLRQEAWIAVGTATAATLLLSLCRWRQPSRRLLEALAVLVLAADLWRQGHGLLVTLPAAAYHTPPPLAAGLPPNGDRIFVETAPGNTPQVMRRWGDPQTLITRTNLIRLEPYSALLWHFPYVFESDFELMLTRWGRRAAAILRQENARSLRGHRYLAAWNVGTLLLRKSFDEQLKDLRNPAAMPLHRMTNAAVLPRFRLVQRVSFHAGYQEALAAARAHGWNFGSEEHWVGSTRQPSTPSRRLPPAHLLKVTDRGSRIQVRYRSAAPTFFVAAMTFDRGWQAFVDDRPREIYPTAACQLGVALPAGDHQLVLRYRQPWLRAGATVSALALSLGGALVLSRWRRFE